MDTADLLERFRRGPELLAAIMTGVFGEEEDYTAEPGKWSIRQIVAHLADAELVGGHRFRQVIAEDNPTLIGYDQDAWARNLDYPRRKPKTSLETFRRLRAENFELLKDLPASAYERAGNHTERGRVTLAGLLDTYTRHAESHAAQIARIRETYKGTKAGRA
jgi:hypothetical protein